MKFGTLRDQKLKFLKSKMAATAGGDRRLDNRFFGHNSCPISAKFCVRKQNGMPTKGHMTKTAHFKIQDGGRPPFGKSLNHHISVKMLLDFDKIWRIPEHILNLMRFSKALSQYLRSVKINE